MAVAVFFCVKYRLNHFTGKITQTQVLHAFDKALQDCRKNAAKFFMGILRINFAKIYDYIFAKFKIISSNFVFREILKCCFAATLASSVATA